VRDFGEFLFDGDGSLTFPSGRMLHAVLRGLQQAAHQPPLPGWGQAGAVSANTPFCLRVNIFLNRQTYFAETHNSEGRLPSSFFLPTGTKESRGITGMCIICVIMCVICVHNAHRSFTLHLIFI